ncbi:MAG: FYDLN acid domain-containing protein [Alphaproteobacteria bacterium]|jgi:uncharacterized protein (TIGR02300 family)|nr:FYDLN acid domain-containing protein [Alphaproteobacteria bacterium]
MMTSLGTKRTCQSCDSKYYDFNKDKIICPSCGEAFDPEVSLKSRRIKPAPTAKPEPQSATVVIEDDDAIDDTINDDDDVVDDNDDDLVNIAKPDDEDENLDVDSTIDEDFLDSEEDEEK